MEIKTIQDIEKIVEQYADASDDCWYLIINKEFIDGIKKWLWEYSISEEGSWLNYSLYSTINEQQIYVLQLSTW